MRGRRLVISIVTVEEILEGAADERAAFVSLRRFAIHGLHLTQARRCALLQRRASRRMGENDAWLVATANSLDADFVGGIVRPSSDWAHGISDSVDGAAERSLSRRI